MTIRTKANAVGILLAAAILAGGGVPGLAPPVAAAEGKGRRMAPMDEARSRDWLARWEKNILADSRNRYCDRELGEEIGWLVTPFLEGFYWGYEATGDTRWVDMLVDWADSWIRRGVKEPDGYIGWPKKGAAGTKVDDLDDFVADSLLGEAMALRPVVRMAGEVLVTPKLKEKYGAKAEGYIELAERVFEKWDKRGAWREAKGGAISVVLPYGIDAGTGRWTEGYARRDAPGAGFSHPDNKANLTARWLLALHDVTRKPIYRERAEKWFRLLRSRLAPRDDGKFKIWNYWEPAGPWDLKADGSPKHWVGVHPNGGYYSVDVEAIVDAHEHGLAFTAEDIERLIATALAEKRYWPALAPYDGTIRKDFEEKLKPESWGGLGAAPWYLALQSRLRQAPQPETGRQ